MTTTAEAPVVRLPRWYAAFDARTPAGPATDGNQAMRVGPLTVFQPGEGCEIASYGNADDPSVVLFDGYVFDRASLTTDLDLQPGVSTAELIAAAYRRWGADVLDRIDGSYLLAVWDAQSRALLVGRDALGHHPVFYAAEPDAFWFSSSVLALASSGRVPTTPNRLSLALSITWFWPEAGQTFFERIRRVRPGHRLTVTADRVVTERKYWEIMPADDEPWLSENEVHDNFEPELTAAVSRCMAMAPQGIMLSGGVDSVTIAALASEYGHAHQREPLVAVSGRTGLAVTPDEEMQSTVARRLNMPHLISTTAEWTKGVDDVSSSLAMTANLPAPSRVYWVGTYAAFYRQAAERGLNVLLTGSGGDNWLAVAETHTADLLARFQFVQLARFMKAKVLTGGASWNHAARSMLWTRGLRPHVDSWWARLAPQHKQTYHLTKWRGNLPPWACPDPALREELVHHLVERRTPPLTERGRVPRNYYRHSLRTTANAYVHYEFETGHHLESLCGVRLLSPYHDRRLVRFLNRISPRVLLQGNRYKGLLRPLVGKLLPGLGLENQRKEYPKTSQDFAVRDLRESIARVWPDRGFERLERLGVVQKAGVRKEIEAAEGYQIPGLARMFTLLSAERWLEIHTGG